MAVDMNKIRDVLTRNVEEVVDSKNLEAALASGKKLRVKLGIDPTGEFIHIGYATVLWKLRAFQGLGHTAVLIIGDFTAQIGDASDKISQRPMLSADQVKKNLKNYLPQIGNILNLRKTEIRYNSEWLKKLSLHELDSLADLFTIRQMIERRNFKTRWEKHEEISLREFHYPLYQGYDSVAVKADVELGGSDQLFNLLAGRKIQEHYGQKPQNILTTKLLVGPDGRKMSKSWGNTINVSDTADEQFGKVMALRDELIPEYFEMTTDMPLGEIAEVKKLLKKKINPKLLKERLAFEVAKRYHGEKEATAAKEKFEALFSKKEIPADIPVLTIKKKSLTALELVMLSGSLKSNGEGRRLIEQGGFEVGGKVVRAPQESLKINGGEVMRVGKKRFYRLSTG